MSAVIERVEPRAVTPSATVNPSQLLQLAMDKGVDLDRLEKLYALQQQWEADEAKKAFTAAMADFKKNPPQIVKDQRVSYGNSKGGDTQYSHASLGAVCDAIIKGLAAVGISHEWDPDTTDPNRIAVTCVLTHSAGHSKKVKMHGPPDPSGGKNAIQAIGSTVTYLERYTLLAAAGIAAMEDDDGRGAGKGKKQETVSEEQIANIKALMTEVNANRDAFMRWARIDSLDQILACNYPHVIKALEEKRKKQ